MVWLIAVMAALGADIHTGYAPRYAPGVMEQVSRNRDMPIVECMVSSPRYPIGTELIVIGLNTQAIEHCRVTDASHPRDQVRHLRTRREVELGYEEARRLCGEQAMQARPEQCPVIVIHWQSQPQPAGRRVSPHLN